MVPAIKSSKLYGICAGGTDMLNCWKWSPVFTFLNVDLEGWSNTMHITVLNWILHSNGF